MMKNNKSKIILKEILQKNCVKNMEFYLKSNSVKNSLKCPKSKSLSHSLSKLFPNYQINIGP